MDDILKIKLEQLKNNQDKYLKDKEEAYKNRKFRGGRQDHDDNLLDRHIAYREGYESGWHEALKQKYRRDNGFVLNETEAFKLMLDGSQIIDEYDSIYLLNREKKHIEVTSECNYKITYDRFLEYQGLKFKIYNEKYYHKYGRIISNFPKDSLEKMKILYKIVDEVSNKIEENKSYKFTIETL